MTRPGVSDGGDGAEDGVLHHRQPRGVDRGLILERHYMRVYQAVQGEGLCGGICGVLQRAVEA